MNRFEEASLSRLSHGSETFGLSHRIHKLGTASLEAGLLAGHVLVLHLRGETGEKQGIQVCFGAQTMVL